MRMGNGMGDRNRHQCLTGSALAYDNRRSRCLQMLGNTRDGQSLSRKRLPQKRLKCWRERIVWPLQRGVHLDDTCPELLRKRSKIFVIGIHSGTPEDGSEHAKTAGVTGRSMGRNGICTELFCGNWASRRGHPYASMLLPRERASSAL